MFLPNLNVVRFILELLKHCSESKQDMVQLQILNLHLCGNYLLKYSLETFIFFLQKNPLRLLWWFSIFHSFFMKILNRPYFDFLWILHCKFILLDVRWPKFSLNLTAFQNNWGRHGDTNKKGTTHYVPGGQTWAKKLPEPLVWIFILS